MISQETKQPTDEHTVIFVRPVFIPVNVSNADIHIRKTSIFYMLFEKVCVFLGSVEGNDLPGRTDNAGKVDGRKTGSAGQIKNCLTGPEARQLPKALGFGAPDFVLELQAIQLFVVGAEQVVVSLQTSVLSKAYSL